MSGDVTQISGKERTHMSLITSGEQKGATKTVEKRCRSARKQVETGEETCQM